MCTDESKETAPVADTDLIERYQQFRTRRFLKREQVWAHSLPGWRTRRRRRVLVVALLVTFAVMFGVGVLCAFGVPWAPLVWLPATLVFLPVWIGLQIVSSRRGDAPVQALDEFEIAQRNSARSIGLTITQNLMMIPVCYLIFGSVITGGTDTDMAYAGGLLTLTVLLIGGCSPAMILGWTRPDNEPDDV